ncbi:hypothetical protein Chor_012345 [Crotalus horridus]
MDEVPKTSNNNSSTSPQIASLQGTTLQEAQLSHVSQQMSLRGPAPLTVVHLSGDQVQGVIHTAQTSTVIHSPQGQSIQVSLSENEDSQDSSDSMDSSQKARGLLARRPSYRKILNDLSSEDTRDRKGDESNAVVTSMPVTTPVYQTSTGQYIAIAPNGPLQLSSPSAESVQGLQTFTNATGTPLLQYVQTSDGQQILVPSNQVVVQTILLARTMQKSSSSVGTAPRQQRPLGPGNRERRELAMNDHFSFSLKQQAVPFSTPPFDWHQERLLSPVNRPEAEGNSWRDQDDPSNFHLLVVETPDGLGIVAVSSGGPLPLQIHSNCQDHTVLMNINHSSGLSTSAD